MSADDRPWQRLIVDVPKALAWPLFAFVVLAIFAGPLRTLLERVGDAAESKVSIGWFSVELQRAATSAGDPELGQLIKGLGGDAIRVLLETGNASKVSLSTPGAEPHPDLQAFEQLTRAGLLEMTNREGRLEYRLTARGKKAFGLIVDAVARQAARG